MLNEITVRCAVWKMQRFHSCHVCLCVCLPLSLPCSQVPLQLPSSSGFTGCIEQNRSKRTAQLSWSPAKWRRTSDAGTCKDCVHLGINYPKLLDFVFNSYIQLLHHWLLQILLTLLTSLLWCSHTCAGCSETC